VTVLLGLLAALSVGSSDFLGGLASRRANPVVVTASSNMVGFVMALFVAAIVGGDLNLTDVAWGTLGGVGVAIGLVSLYAGYAKARVSVAAPVAGVGAAALPVIAESLVGNDDLSARGTTGVLIGLLAIGLVSIGKSDQRGTVGASMLYGLGGAIGIGMLLMCLSRTSDDSGLWPVVAARGSGFAALAVVIAATSVRAAVPRPVVPHVIAIAVLITAGNTMFLAATRIGSTSVAAVLTSLFPAVTVFWAWMVFREPLRAIQLVGLAVAVVAVSLIAAG
jgi:drug/metabolite transporter (DMT)-like permease